MNGGAAAVPSRSQRWLLFVARAIGEPCLAAAFVCLCLASWTEEARRRGEWFGCSCLLVGCGAWVVRCTGHWVAGQRIGGVAMLLGALGGALAAIV
jgi:hypothetical protein